MQQQFEDVKGFAKKHFPAAVESGLLPNDGEQLGFPIKGDPSKTEKVLGIKAKGFEEMMVDLIGQYVELKEKEAKEA